MQSIGGTALIAVGVQRRDTQQRLEIFLVDVHQFQCRRDEHKQDDHRLKTQTSYPTSRIRRHCLHPDLALLAGRDAVARQIVVELPARCSTARLHRGISDRIRPRYKIGKVDDVREPCAEWFTTSTRTAHNVLISLSAGLVDLRVKIRNVPLGDSLKIRPSRSPVVTSAVRLAVDESMIQALPPAR